MPLDFRERALLLGHSLDVLDAGMRVTSVFTIHSVDHLKIVTQLLQDQCVGSTLTAHLLGSVPLKSVQEDSSPEAVMRRVNEFVFGDTVLDETDRAFISSAFPMQVQATSETNATPATARIIHAPGTPQIFNYGTLILNQGIYFSFISTPVTSFSVDNLIRNGNSGDSSLGDINILGMPGANGGNGPDGKDGDDGANGYDEGTNGSSPFTAGNGAAGGNGANGTAGTSGADGATGRGAVIYLNQTITVNNGDGTIKILARAGAGGNGGNGGKGGRGGKGGNGGNGFSIPIFSALGNGGAGGNGGNAGNGGNGGNAAYMKEGVLVTVAASMQRLITTLAEAASGGSAGEAGLSGPYGAGGAGGTGFIIATGRAGADGADGQPGSNGTGGGNETPATITVYGF